MQHQQFKIRANGRREYSNIIQYLFNHGIKPVGVYILNGFPEYTNRDKFILVDGGDFSLCSEQTFESSYFTELRFDNASNTIISDQHPEPNKWDIRFLRRAFENSKWSKDPSTKCGAVLVRPDKSIASDGYNGFPPGVLDSDERLNDRDVKNSIVRHAEQNAITFCRDVDMSDLTLYVWPFQPCTVCMGEIITRKIKKVVSFATDPSNPKHQRWEANFKLARDMASEVGIELVLLPLALKSEIEHADD